MNIGDKCRHQKKTPEYSGFKLVMFFFFFVLKDYNFIVCLFVIKNQKLQAQMHLRSLQNLFLLILYYFNQIYSLHIQFFVQLIVSKTQKVVQLTCVQLDAWQYLLTLKRSTVLPQDNEPAAHCVGNGRTFCATATTP